MKKCNLEISSIETMGLLDGPGVRVVVFCSKCALRCIYCHNPETWSCKGEIVNIDDLFDKIMKYKNYIKNGGVTFSGGEPLLQAEELIPLITRLKQEGIHVAIDTAGYVNITENVKKVIELSDLIIMDIKEISAAGYTNMCGGNIRFQEDFITFLNSTDKDVWIRQVIIPGINDSVNYISEFNRYINRIKNIKRVELLGYHDMAKKKYEDLGIPYQLSDKPSMSFQELNKLEKMIAFDKKD